MGQLRTCELGGGCPPVDYHMHTTYSDGDSTIAEYVERARELGLEEIAITDHVWRSSDWVADYVEEVRAVADDTDLTVHVGLEAKVIDREGSVDVAPEDADRVDFVMGVVHRYRPNADPPHDDSCNYTPREATRHERDLTLALLENPTVDVVGHPTRNYHKFHYDEDAPEYPDEYLETMIEKADSVGKPLEYNARLPAHIRERLLDYYVVAGLPFTVGSDSHHADRLKNLDHDGVTAALTGEKYE